MKGFPPGDLIVWLKKASVQTKFMYEDGMLGKTKDIFLE